MSAISKKNIWVIVPGYNEEKYLSSVLKKLLPVTKNVIFVDDGSTDTTAEIAQKHLEHILIHDLNLGKGAAMKTGCEYAFEHLGAQAIIFMDADDQHDPTELELFFAALENNYDVVFGERKMGSEMPLLRIIGNRLASLLVYLLFGRYIPDIPSGFKALSKKAFMKVYWHANRYEVELEIASKVAKYRLPYKTVQIKTIYHDMDRGMSPLEAIRMAAKIISWRVTL